MKSYSYHRAEFSRHGLMICSACNRRIETGEYRCRETKDRYITHHRTCSEEDPQWKKLDEQFQKRLTRAMAIRADFDALRAKWDLSSGDFEAYAEAIEDEHPDET